MQAITDIKISLKLVNTDSVALRLSERQGEFISKRA